MIVILYRWEMIFLFIFICSRSAALAKAFSHTHLQSHSHLAKRQETQWNRRNDSAHISSNGTSRLNTKQFGNILTDDDAMSTITTSSRSEIYIEDIFMENDPIGDSSVVSVVAKGVMRGGEESFCHGSLSAFKDDDMQIYQACIIEFSGAVSTSVDMLAAVLHELLLRYLEIEGMYETAINTQSSSPSSLSAMKFTASSSNEHLDGNDAEELSKFLHLIGLLALNENNKRHPPMDDSLCMIDLHKFVPHLHEYAFYHRGTSQGRKALMLLAKLSARRVPFDFEGHDSKSKSSIRNTMNGRGVISHEKNIIPSSAVDNVMKIMQVMKRRRWLSTNPDSVDGLPSLHLNLISGGSPMFDKDIMQGEDESEGMNEETRLFQQNIASMTAVVRPYLFDTLLPRVRSLTNSSTVEISDVFIRSYGEVKVGGVDDEEETTTRYGLSSHYDITSFATCVIALDETASNGRSGLYTIPLSRNGEVSNHSALKKFFPLNTGDGVMHTHDILHGVDVDPKLNCPRTSLIVWFVDRGNEQDARQCKFLDEEDSINTANTVDQPWLLQPKDDDDVGQFILALASDAGYEPDGSEIKIKDQCKPFDLYISSASCGNAFALTSLGQLCDDNDSQLSDDHFSRIETLLRNLTPSNPFLLESKPINGQDCYGAGDADKEDLYIAPCDVNRQYRCKAFAKALWYKASMSGNRIAQVSLADELMLQYMTEKQDSSTDNDATCQQNQEDLLLMASTLFIMALNQGFESAEDALQRLMDVECRRLAQSGVQIPSEKFFLQPVVQTILLSS